MALRVLTRGARFTIPREQGRRQLKGREVCVITGATGQIGWKIAEESLKRGNKVVAISRDGGALKKITYPNLTVKTLSLREQQTPKIWKKLFQDLTSEEDTVRVVHALGTPDQSQDLMGINVAPLAAAVEALEEATEKGWFKKARVVDINSLAPAIFEAAGATIDDPYTESRMRAIEVLKESPLPHTLTLKVSYGLPDYHPELSIYDTQHAWGPDQMANFFVQMVLGNGEQVVQPVFISTLVDAALAFQEGKQAINGVGVDRMTMKEFFTFFSHLIGKEPHIMHLSYERALALAELGEIGHCARYSVVCSKLLEKHAIAFDPQPMLELIGYTPPSVRTLLDIKEKLTFPNPSYTKHIEAVVKKSLSSPTHAIRLIKFLFGHAPVLLSEMLRARFR